MIDLPPVADLWLPPKPAIIRPAADLHRAVAPFFVPVVGWAAPATPSTFVNGIATNGAGAATVVWPTNTVAGDIGIIILANNAGGTTQGTSDWANGVASSTESNSVNMRCYVGVISAGDISSPPSVTPGTSGGFFVATFRGGSAIVHKNSVNDENGVSTIDVPGFTKNAASRKIVAVALRRDNTHRTWDSVSGGLASNYVGASPVVNSEVNVASADPADYTSGTTVTFTLSGTDDGSGQIFEIT